MLNDLNLYRVFYTVCQYQNFSHAAQALYISQPAISKSIKTLENNLGITLFSRGSKGVLLTPEGKLLYDHLENAFSSITQGEMLLNKLKNMESGELKVGVSSTLGTHFLLPLLSQFTKTYPALQVHVINDNTTQTLNLIEQNLIDLAIISSPLTHTSLEFVPLQSIEDIFVCSPTYYNSNIKDLSPKEICEQGYFMLLSKRSITRLNLQAHFAQLGLELTPTIEASNMDFLIECAKAGLGITSVIKSFITKELETGTLIEIPLMSLPTRYIGVAYHPRLQLSIASHTFITFLQQRF